MAPAGAALLAARRGARGRRRAAGPFPVPAAPRTAGGVRGARQPRRGCGRRPARPGATRRVLPSRVARRLRPPRSPAGHPRPRRLARAAAVTAEPGSRVGPVTKVVWRRKLPHDQRTVFLSVRRFRAEAAEETSSCLGEFRSSSPAARLSHDHRDCLSLKILACFPKCRSSPTACYSTLPSEV